MSGFSRGTIEELVFVCVTDCFRKFLFDSVDIEPRFVWWPDSVDGEMVLGIDSKEDWLGYLVPADNFMY